MIKLLFILTFCFPLISSAEESNPRCIGEVCFPSEVSDTSVRFLNATRFRYFGFKVYSAALYASASSQEVKSWINKESLEPPRIALVIHYYRDFDAEDFITSGTDLMKENKTVQMDTIANEISKMNLLYRPVKEGDEYTILFSPEKGTSLLLNNNLIGSVPGVEFGRAYLGIWLSKTSIGESFTEALLK